MDILNWIYLKTNELIRPTANNTNTDIIALGANVGPIQRGDSYQTYGMTIQDFANTIATLLPPPNVGLFSQIVNGPTITNTIAESSIIGSGVGSLSVPANGFSVGDSFHAKAIGHLTCNGSATVRVKIKSGSVILADTGVIAMNAATAKHWEINVYFTIRALGVPGIASIASGGIFSYTKNSGTNFEGTNFSIVNNTTFDTTTSNTLDVTVQWGSATVANSIYSEIFTLNKTY